IRFLVFDSDAVWWIFVGLSISGWLAFCVVLLGGVVSDGKLRVGASMRVGVVFLLPALPVLAWYVIFVNHTVVHPWLAVRFISGPAALGLSAVISLLTAHAREGRGRDTLPRESATCQASSAAR